MTRHDARQFRQTDGGHSTLGIETTDVISPPPVVRESNWAGRLGHRDREHS